MASWGGFWNGLGKTFAKIAVWAAANPQVIQEVINATQEKK